MCGLTPFLVTNKAINERVSEREREVIFIVGQLTLKQ
jgi:hypothetical protein